MYPRRRRWSPPHACLVRAVGQSSPCECMSGQNKTNLCLLMSGRHQGSAALANLVWALARSSLQTQRSRQRSHLVTKYLHSSHTAPSLPQSVRGMGLFVVWPRCAPPGRAHLSASAPELPASCGAVPLHVDMGLHMEVPSRTRLAHGGPTSVTATSRERGGIPNEAGRPNGHGGVEARGARARGFGIAGWHWSAGAPAARAVERSAETSSEAGWSKGAPFPTSPTTCIVRTGAVNARGGRRRPALGR